MFSRFFIDRPIFASVLSIVITLAGLVAVFTLPITQYPNITPPTVEVSAVFPNANSRVVSDTVAAPIEQQVNGVEGMMYMSSQCTNDGTYTLTVTFKPGIDLNIAQVLVQNRVNLAQPVLPDIVKRLGVTVKKKSPAVLMIVNLYSPEQNWVGPANVAQSAMASTQLATSGLAPAVCNMAAAERIADLEEFAPTRRDSLYLSNYATIQLRDELARLNGVGDISYMGQRDYSMRLWLDPEKMHARSLTASDVI